MNTVTLRQPKEKQQLVTDRAEALAERLENGADALVRFAEGLTSEEWSRPLPHDGRKIGVIVHHVANMYPLEIQLAQMIAAGTPVTGVTYADVDKINAEHAVSSSDVTKEAALEAVRKTSAAAAAAIRALSDEELDRAVPNSMYEDAPLTCQFMLEDHAVRHSYHHLMLIRRALKR